MARRQTMDHTDLLVLSLLSQGDMYGYQMIAELDRQSDHTFTMKEGTLYPILHALEQAGAVESYRTQAPTGRERKYYRLTEKGASLLKTETEQWRRYSQGINAILEQASGLA